MRLKALSVLFLSSLIGAGVEGQTQMSATKKKTSSATAEQWEALEETVAKQQKAIEKLLNR